MAIGRKRSETGGSSAGASNNIRQVGSLFSGFNRSPKAGNEFEDGVVGEQEPLLTLKIGDEELVKLSNQWQGEYNVYDKKIKSRSEENYKYWKGEQHGSQTSDSRGVDNIVFESTETLLPIVSRQNPEPNVTGEDTEEGTFVGEMTSKILARKADETRLKSKIKTVARQWMINFIGVFKMGWSEELDDMYFQIIAPDHVLLDPKGQFDGGEFRGRFIGEAKTATAQELVDTFPKYTAEITASVDGKMGTTISYHEWWTDKYVFWRYRDVILDKRDNPYWNGEVEKDRMDASGVASKETVQGVNHFAAPKMPYAFLSVFNTGKQPHDETSLIEQVKSLQDIINKRLKQIDKNADDTNTGWVFNNSFSLEQAKTALDALRNGGAIIATTEAINESVTRFAAPPLAPFVYQDMQDKREQVYNIMGVRGSTAQGVLSEKTVRGKIEIKGQDVDRLSLVIEQIEQCIDHLYNLATQTIYVYYDIEQATRALGAENAAKYIQLLKAGPSRRLVVSVKEGSTIPQDPLLRRNESMDLWDKQAIDPETLFERLGDFPDPKAAALKLETYKQNPAQYFADLGGTPPAPVAPVAPAAPPMAPQEQAGMIPFNIGQ
jgi:hypothetical protein